MCEGEKYWEDEVKQRSQNSSDIRMAFHSYSKFRNKAMFFYKRFGYGIAYWTNMVKWRWLYSVKKIPKVTYICSLSLISERQWKSGLHTKTFTTAIKATANWLVFQTLSWKIFGHLVIVLYISNTYVLIYIGMAESIVPHFRDKRRKMVFIFRLSMIPCQRSKCYVLLPL